MPSPNPLPWERAIFPLLPWEKGLGDEGIQGGSNFFSISLQLGIQSFINAIACFQKMGFGIFVVGTRSI